MDIGILSRLKSFDDMYNFFLNLEKEYQKFSFEEVSSFGNYLIDYLHQYQREFLAGDKLTKTIFKIEKIILIYEEISLRSNKRDMFEEIVKELEDFKKILLEENACS